MHFAAKSVVSESVRNPLDYFENNVIGSINLIRAVTEKRIKAFVFSSTAAVYGDPITEIIDEQHPIKPINPYGQTKAIVESLLMEASRAYGLCSISFRYFNAAGAAPERMLGEDHQPETHLIPNVLRSCLSKRNPVLEVFGTDYDTSDGSCVRDYVHVKDLAEAHTLGMAHLLKNGGRHQVNLGTRDGASVLEVIRICERVTGVSLSLDIALRREGDPPSLIANNALARNLLGWAPTRSLEDCIRDAWLWHKSDFRAE
jgi:UDP-glucose 4-epimerase